MTVRNILQADISSHNMHACVVTQESDTSAVNMLHLQLLRHLMNEEFMLFGYAKSDFEMFHTEIMDKMLATPYLMNQALAFAALHLSISSETGKEEYQYHAKELQTHALNLFTLDESTADLNTDNCLPVFLFNSIRALHAFCERITFSTQDPETFLQDFVEILYLYKRVRQITNQSWNRLLESPLQQALEKEAENLIQAESLLECANLQKMVDSASIDEFTRETYREAVEALQIAMNASLRNSSGQPTPGPIISWLVVVPSGYIHLLAEKRTEALVILAHFGALLHLQRDTWVFGNSGLYAFDSISSYLDSTSDIWLQWPKQVFNVQ